MLAISSSSPAVAPSRGITSSGNGGARGGSRSVRIRSMPVSSQSLRPKPADALALASNAAPMRRSGKKIAYELKSGAEPACRNWCNSGPASSYQPIAYGLSAGERCARAHASGAATAALHVRPASRCAAR
jgi:hypothetical protein